MMAANFLILLIVIGLTVLFGWLTRRTWRAPNPGVKWIGTLLGAVITLGVASISVLALLGVFRYYNPPSNPVKEVKVDGTPEQIARGEHLAAALCVECHSTTDDFPMTGGVDLGRDLPINVGSYYSANLTPAGPLRDWTEGEIFRALRDNVGKDGNRLVAMSGTNVRYISDEDILALIAFLRSSEPVASELPQPLDQPNFLGLLIAGANLVPDRPLITEPIVAPKKEATAEYGQFMMTFLDCKNCHGEDLSGGTDPFQPKGPSLRVVKHISSDGFIIVLRTGVTPLGKELNSLMPWRSIGRLDDTELTALYKYLVSLQ